LTPTRSKGRMKEVLLPMWEVELLESLPGVGFMRGTVIWLEGDSLIGSILLPMRG